RRPAERIAGTECASQTAGPRLEPAFGDDQELVAQRTVAGNALTRSHPNFVEVLRKARQRILVPAGKLATGADHPQPVRGGHQWTCRGKAPSPTPPLNRRCRPAATRRSGR